MAAFRANKTICKHAGTSNSVTTQQSVLLVQRMTLKATIPTRGTSNSAGMDLYRLALN